MKDVDRAAIYDDALANFDISVGGGGRRGGEGDNTRKMHWEIGPPNVGLVDHA